MYLYLNFSVKWGIQNTNLSFIDQCKNDTCPVQSLKNDFYLGALRSSDCDFTPMVTIV
jgi:hypothetical protein